MATGARRLLSVIGSVFDEPSSDDEIPLPQLVFSVPLAERLAERLGALGYLRDEAMVDLPAEELGRQVEARLEACEPGEVLIVHLIGHGVIHERTAKLLVVGRDSRSGPRTEVERWLTAVEGRAETDGSPAPRVLFLVDLCYAGAVAKLAWQGDIPDEERRAWVIAATGERDPAFAGRFSRAVAHMLERVAAGALDISPTHPFVPIERVAQEIRREVDRLSEQSYQQRVIAIRTDPAAIPDFPFIPNPAFDAPPGSLAHAGSTVDEMTRPFLSSLDEAMDWRHFAARAAGGAAGVLDLSRPGVFRGRHRELQVIAGVLDSRTTPCLVVVTGSPGSGKSALLGITVCAAMPELTDVTEPLWRDHRDRLPAVQDSLVAVHCRQQHVTDIVASISRQLRLPVATADVTVLAKAIEDRRILPSIVLDAVDEAMSPQDLMTEVILPLSNRARVIVGVRPWPEFAPLLESAHNDELLIDLDAVPVEELQRDLAAYVEDLLRPVYRTAALRAPRQTMARIVAEVLAAPQPEFVLMADTDPVIAEDAEDAPVEDAGTAPVEDARTVPAEAHRDYMEDFLEGLNAGTEDMSGLDLVLDLRRQYEVERQRERRRELEERSDPEGSPWATQRTEGRWGAFLVAGLFSHHLLARPVIGDLAEAEAAARAVPLTLPEVFELDLSELAGDAEHQRPVLTILALSFGSGVPRTVIERSVGLLPGGTMDPPAVADALDASRFYLRRGIDALGSTVYRLFHQGLADHLRMQLAVPLPSAHAELLDRLVRPLGTPARWSLAEPYLLRHAVDHAAIAGRLDVLITDPGFLCYADRGALDQRIDEVRRPEIEPIRRTYWEAAGRGWDLGPTERRSLLVVQGHRLGYRNLARRLAVVADLPDLGWTMRWASFGQPQRADPWWWEVIEQGRRIEGGSAPSPVSVRPDDEAVPQVTDAHKGAVRALAFTEGGRIVSAARDRQVQIRDGATGALDRRLVGHRDWVNTVAVGRLGLRPVALSAGADGEARLWDRDTGDSLMVLTGHTGWIRGSDLTRYRGEVVGLTAAHDFTARVWDLGTGACLRRLTLTGNALTCVAGITRNDRLIVAVGGTSRDVVLWDVEDDAVTATLTGHTGRIWALATTELDGRSMVITGGEDRSVKLWDITTAECLLTLGGFRAAVTAVAAGERSGRPVVLAGSEDGAVRGWDLHGGELVVEATFPGAVGALATTDDGVVAVGFGNDIAVIDLAAQEWIQQ